MQQEVISWCRAVVVRRVLVGANQALAGPLGGHDDGKDASARTKRNWNLPPLFLGPWTFGDIDLGLELQCLGKSFTAKESEFRSISRVAGTDATGSRTSSLGVIEYLGLGLISRETAQQGPCNRAAPSIEDRSFLSADGIFVEPVDEDGGSILGTQCGEISGLAESG